MSAVPERVTSADVIVWGEGNTFTQQIVAGRHRLTGDEPESIGGHDTGPSPYDFLLAALGSCVSMTIGMYARKKELVVGKGNGLASTLEDIRRRLLGM